MWFKSVWTDNSPRPYDPSNAGKRTKHVMLHLMTPLFERYRMSLIGLRRTLLLGPHHDLLHMFVRHRSRMLTICCAVLPVLVAHRGQDILYYGRVRRVTDPLPCMRILSPGTSKGISVPTLVRQLYQHMSF